MEITSVFNPLYSDGFSHTDKCDKDEIVHSIFQGVTGRISQIMLYFSP